MANECFPEWLNNLKCRLSVSWRMSLYSFSVLGMTEDWMICSADKYNN